EGIDRAGEFERLDGDLGDTRAVRAGVEGEREEARRGGGQVDETPLDVGRLRDVARRPGGTGGGRLDAERPRSRGGGPGDAEAAGLAHLAAPHPHPLRP